jgi:creatinine amidohydrolase
MLDPFDLPHVEARELLGSGAPLYLPVNPVEYHGPHLSLRNDAHVSLGLARDLHARIFPDVPLLVARDLELGVEPCPGPGTRAAPFTVVVTAVREAVRAAVELGARRIVLVTFHGAPMHAHALDEGISEAERLGARAAAPLTPVLAAMVELDDPSPLAPACAHIEDERVRREVLEGLQFDFHAGFFETSLALHYAPKTVSDLRKTLPPCPVPQPDPALATASRVASAMGRTELARELAFAAVGQAWNALRPFPGYTSRPDVASPEAGRFFSGTLLDLMVPVVRDALLEGRRQPEPLMRWLRAVTLDGRIPTSKVPLDQVLATSAT